MLLLQSCIKDPHDYNPFEDDKLLLSKVTGVNDGITFNTFEYTRRPGNRFSDYYASYAYSNERYGWVNYKAMQQVSYANGGVWNFSYSDRWLDKIMDHSIPGRDLGYWKLYYNSKGQVIKTGLAFSEAADPTEFEFYEYDSHNNLVSLVYGTYVDTPVFKQTYIYDNRGNLTQWEAFFPIGYQNLDQKSSNRIFSSLAASPETERALGTRRVELFKQILQKHSADNSSFLRTADRRAPGDSNVLYQNWFIAKVTSDGKTNPYNQQGGLLFFPGNRLHSSDLNANYWALQKSNPLLVQYTASPDFGGLTMTSTFTYTYNNQGYPITSHEDFMDQGVWWGSEFSYTQDRQYEYIRNFR